MIVVTGVTGELGRHVMEFLVRAVPGREIVAAVRNVQRAERYSLYGVRLRACDYRDYDSMAGAFEGADQVLLVSASDIGPGRVALHDTAIRAARANGVGHLVYTSLLHADSNGLAIGSEHVATEQLIRESGITATVLRNGWYGENSRELIRNAAGHGEIVGSAGQGRQSPATRPDLAEAAVAVLAGRAERGRTYELAGDEAWSYDELAATVSDVIGRPVRYRDLTPEQHYDLLLEQGVFPDFAELVVRADEAMAAGHFHEPSPDLSRLIGRPSTSLRELVVQNVGDLLTRRG